MVVYLCLYAGALYAAYLTRYLKEKKIVARIVMAGAFFVSVCRSYLMGADYETYIRYWKSGGYNAYGWGYRILNEVGHRIGESYVCLAAVLNVVIFFVVLLCYQKCVAEEYFLFAILLWIINPYCYIQGSFNLLRQGCAMAALLAASCFLGNKTEIRGKRFWQYIMFFLLLFVAAGFHKSAGVFILLIPFTMVKWNRGFHVILLAICASVNFLAHDSAFMSLFTKYFGFEGYLTYFKSIFDIPLFAVFITCFVVFLILKYDSLFNNEKEKWYVDLYICSLSILLLLVKNDQAYRLYVYLFYITIVSVTIILKNLPARISQMMRYSYVAYYSLMFWGFLVLQKMDHNIRYYPFTFFWQVK